MLIQILTNSNSKNKSFPYFFMNVPKGILPIVLKTLSFPAQRKSSKITAASRAVGME